MPDDFRYEKRNASEQVAGTCVELMPSFCPAITIMCQQSNHVRLGEVCVSVTRAVADLRSPLPGACIARSRGRVAGRRHCAVRGLEHITVSNGSLRQYGSLIHS
jgi:hypothetical protein